VGELESSDPVDPPGLLEPARLKKALPTSPDPHGIAPSCEAIAKPRSRYSVCGSRPAVSTTARFSGETPSGAEAPEAPVDLGFPSGYSPNQPRRDREAPTTLLGFDAPTATSVRRSTDPGFHTRFVPPPGFLTLLTAYSLQHLPIPKDRCHSWGSPCRAFPLRRAARLSAPLPSCRFWHRVLLL
jgi:hypothetical protein